MAKKLTKKQIQDRAKRGWSTRRAKAAAAAASDGNLIRFVNGAQANRSEDAIASAVGTELPANVSEAINNFDIARLRKATDKDLKEQLGLVIAFGRMMGIRDGRQETENNFDRVVVRGLVNEVTQARKVDGQLWTVSDYVLRSTVRELQRLREELQLHRHMKQDAGPAV